MGRDDTETAYFTLLRARETVTAMLRYTEFLELERARLRRFVAEGTAHDETADARMRRSLRHTDIQLAEALKLRHSVIDDELRRLPDRLAAAEAFVTECEVEHDRLRAHAS